MKNNSAVNIIIALILALILTSSSTVWAEEPSRSKSTKQRFLDSKLYKTRDIEFSLNKPFSSIGKRWSQNGKLVFLSYINAGAEERFAKDWKGQNLANLINIYIEKFIKINKVKSVHFGFMTKNNGKDIYRDALEFALKEHGDYQKKELISEESVLFLTQVFWKNEMIGSFVMDSQGVKWSDISTLVIPLKAFINKKIIPYFLPSLETYKNDNFVLLDNKAIKDVIPDQESFYHYAKAFSKESLVFLTFLKPDDACSELLIGYQNTAMMFAEEQEGPRKPVIFFNITLDSSPKSTGYFHQLHKILTNRNFDGYNKDRFGPNPLPVLIWFHGEKTPAISPLQHLEDSSGMYWLEWRESMQQIYLALMNEAGYSSNAYDRASNENIPLEESEFFKRFKEINEKTNAISSKCVQRYISKIEEELQKVEESLKKLDGK